MKYHLHTTVDYIVEADDESQAIGRITGCTIPFVISRNTIIMDICRHDFDESPSYEQEHDL